MLDTMKFNPPTPAILLKLFHAKCSFGKVVKNKKNPFYNSMYTDYDGLLAAISKPLEDQKLLLLQPTIVLDGKPYVRTTIVDAESGEAVWGDFPISTVVETSAKVSKGFDGVIPTNTREINSQEQGSSTTYARRYGLSALLGLPADEDDDGNAAVGNTTTTARERGASTATSSKRRESEEALF